MSEESAEPKKETPKKKATKKAKEPQAQASLALLNLLANGMKMADAKKKLGIN